MAVTACTTSPGAGSYAKSGRAGSVLANRAGHELGRDDRYLAALGPGLGPDLFVGGVRGTRLVREAR